jgi:ubiquinone/menaquinone biosynthesis C-methylase UbiE
VQAFHHWTDKEAGLREASRVLMAGGRFLIAERSSKGKHGITLEAAGHLADRLTDLGFSRAHTSSHGSLILVEARKELRQ